MNTLTKFFSTALVAAATLLSFPAYAIDAGAAAPQFDLPGASGNVKLADMKGKFVYVDFWASWCGPCKQSFPWMNDLQAKLGPKGLQVVGINVDAKQEDAQKFLSQVPAKFTVAFDAKGDFPKKYGIKGMPSSVLVGPDGQVIWAHTGFKEDEAKELEEKIASAIAKGK
jgi:cytochrome c biogenesis protein CcmG, thiol:disulfide interchange protein DsbE